jgi:LytS/YehU family sensor histidine kinase
MVAYVSICLLAFLIAVITPRVILAPWFNRFDHEMERHHHEEEEGEQFAMPPSMSADSAFAQMPVPRDHEEHKPPRKFRRHHDEGDGIMKYLGGHHFFFDISHNFFMLLMIIFFSLTIKIRNRWRKAEKERLNAELSYLKAQINPHFLFNTLNSIYSLAIEKSDYTPTAVVKLSGMMRYVITDAARDFVALEKEVNYIRDFVDLQKIRFGETVDVDFTVSGDKLGKKIAPLLLIAFIENAFKYGVNPEEKSEIYVSIQVFDSKITLIVRNKKVNSLANGDLSSKVGIENTMSRLNLIYANKYKLNFDDSENEYKVELTIELI